MAGQKNAAFAYAKVKSYVIREKPIATQVVLQNTISRGKNLRSIVNKIIMQMVAKMGGVPWAISDLPLI